MDEVILKNLWLHGVCGYEPECVDAVLSVFKSAENAFGIKAKDIEYVRKQDIPRKFAKRYDDVRYLKEAELILEYCNKKGIRIITMESDEYPECLKNVYLPPRVLFAVGKKLDFQSRIGVSVVGCRKASDKGLIVAEQLGTDLARNGITVISGMADGIDAAAMNGALKTGGRTIAVLAGWVEDIYPKSNKGLYYRVIENGTVLSERPPGTRVKGYFYQQRNRIMVGLSEGVLIIEGKVKSGTAITTRLATENNREVFAVPGSPTVWQAALPNSLISDGAVIVDRVGKVSEYFCDRYPEKVGKTAGYGTEQTEKRTVKGLQDEDRKIIAELRKNGGVATIDMLAEGCDIPVGNVGVRLTVLGIKGIIKQESGNKVLLIGDPD